MLYVRSTTAALAAALLLAGAANAGTIFDTGFGQSDFGYVGEDIYPDQSVGVAFQPSFNCTLDSVGLWMMSNDFDNPGRTFTLKLVTDNGAGPSIPNEANVLETWNASTGAVGWNPELDTFDSVAHPLLTAGQWYWLVASSTEEAGVDPLWVWASNDVQYYSGINNSFNPNGWEGGYSYGSTPGTVVNASAVPEPAAIGLLALAGVGTLRRRRA